MLSPFVESYEGLLLRTRSAGADLLISPRLLRRLPTTAINMSLEQYQTPCAYLSLFSNVSVSKNPLGFSLSSRWASSDMSKLFSSSVSTLHCFRPSESSTGSSALSHFGYQTRFGTWRKLWLNLAKAEKELGLPIPDDAISQMEKNLVSLITIFVCIFEG